MPKEEHGESTKKSTTSTSTNTRFTRPHVNRQPQFVLVSRTNEVLNSTIALLSSRAQAISPEEFDTDVAKLNQHGRGFVDLLCTQVSINRTDCMIIVPELPLLILVIICMDSFVPHAFVHPFQVCRYDRHAKQRRKGDCNACFRNPHPVPNRTERPTVRVYRQQRCSSSSAVIQLCDSPLFFAGFCLFCVFVFWCFFAGVCFAPVPDIFARCCSKDLKFCLEFFEQSKLQCPS